MRVDLAYGRTGLTVELPDQTDIVTSRFVPGLPDEAAALRAALRRPIDSLPLAAKVKPGDKVVIAHSDITRATPNERILPVLLAELAEAGVARQDITLLNALGTHRQQTEAELRQMLGDSIVDSYRCLQHTPPDEANLVSLAGLLWLPGAHQPHLYGGGRTPPDRLYRAALLCRLQRRPQGNLPAWPEPKAC